MRFRDITGHTALCNHLTESVDAGRISNTQLFHGPTSDGSLALALAYAQYVNCEHRQHFDTASPDQLRADSCGECPHCKKMQQLVYADLMLVFPNAATASVKNKPYSALFQEEFRDFVLSHDARGTLDDWFQHLSIENKQGIVRELDADDIVNKLSLTAYEGGYKVVVIWMAEKMNQVAANKLLKTLEEPTNDTLLIMVAENTEQMLSTILSRAQQVYIPSLSSGSKWPEAFHKLFVEWMRMLFKLNMATLSEQVDKLAAYNREEQKLFLSFVSEQIRGCFLQTAAGRPVVLSSGDAKFDAAFPAMVTQRNVEKMAQALNDTLYAIERNAAPKIAFMQLSFTLSKLIKQR